MMELKLLPLLLILHGKRVLKLIILVHYLQVKKGRESLAEYLNAKLDERTNLNLVKVVETILGRVDSIMAKGFLDCRVFAQHIAFYILGATIFGEAFLDWPNSTMYEELLMMVAKDGCFWASCKVPPFWSVGYWRYHLLCAKLKHLTREIVQLYRCNYSTATQDDLKKCTGTQQVGEEIRMESTSLLNNVISGSFIQCDIDGYLCSQEEPCGNILGLMFHGSLAIASLIGGVITRLVLHPELQGKVIFYWPVSDFLVSLNLIWVSIYFTRNIVISLFYVLSCDPRCQTSSSFLFYSLRF